MPLTLTVSDGLLPQGEEKVIFKELCDLMLKWHGILGNKVMTPNVVGAIHVIPEGYTFSGGETNKVAFIEWKVPSFVFSDRDVQKGYIQDATNLLCEKSNGQIQKQYVWVNVVHTVDGAWGINSEALTNEDLKFAIAQG